MDRLFRKILPALLVCALVMTLVPAEVIADEGAPVPTGGLIFPGSQNPNAKRQLIQMDGSYCHTVGLYSDGTVVAVGDNTEG